MFKVGQKVLFTEASEEGAPGTIGVIVEVDENDEDVPYYVEYLDDDRVLITNWCYGKEIEAYGEVIE